MVQNLMLLPQIWSTNYLKSNALAHFDALLCYNSILNVNIAPKTIQMWLNNCTIQCSILVAPNILSTSLPHSAVWDQPLFGNIHKQIYFFGLGLGSQ